jgi:hypothetical protein
MSRVYQTIEVVGKNNPALADRAIVNEKVAAR